MDTITCVQRPLLGSSSIGLHTYYARATAPSTGEEDAPHKDPEVEHVTWENERKDPRLGWSSLGLLETDPPHFRSGQVY